MPNPLDLSALRRYAVARTLFAPITLWRALDKLGFVQADPSARQRQRLRRT